MGTLLEAGSLAGDYVNGLLQAVLALAVVAGLAYVALRFMPQNVLFGRRGRLLEVEETLRLDAKSSLSIVRIEGRRLLVGTHSQAAVTLLAELDGLSPKPSAKLETVALNARAAGPVTGEP